MIVILSPTTAAPVGYSTREVTGSILCFNISISSILTLLLWNVDAEISILSGLLVVVLTATQVDAPVVNNSVVGYMVSVAQVFAIRSYVYTYAVLAPRTAISLLSYQATQGAHLRPFHAQGAQGITGIAGLDVFAEVVLQVAVPRLNLYI